MPETCVVAILVRLTSSHGYDAARLDGVAEYLLDQQLADGGWNCATRTDKSKHSSLYTSIQALEALDAYTSAGGAVDANGSVLRGASSYSRTGCTSHTAPEQLPSGSTRFFPALPEWHFDVLRGLEHFSQGGAQRDRRLRDAFEVLRSARRKDGRWPTYSLYPGRQWFQLEPPGPSRWNTCRALRVAVVGLMISSAGTHDQNVHACPYGGPWPAASDCRDASHAAVS